MGIGRRARSASAAVVLSLFSSVPCRAQKSEPVNQPVESELSEIFSWDRAGLEEECPSSQWVSAALEKLLGQSLPSALVDGKLQLGVVRRGAGYELSIKLFRGATERTRVITHPDSCRELSEAGVLIAAFAVDPALADRLAAGDSRAQADEVSRSTSAEGPKKKERTTQGATRGFRWAWTGSAAISWDGGALPESGAGFLSTFGARRLAELDSWLFVARGTWSTKREARVDASTTGASAGADFSRWTVGPHVCWQRPLFSRQGAGGSSSLDPPRFGAGLCGGMSAGSTRVSSQGLMDGRDLGRLWMSVQLGARLSGHLVGPFSVVFAGDAEIPFDRTSYQLEGGETVFQQGFAGFRASLGIEGVFPHLP